MMMVILGVEVSTAEVLLHAAGEAVGDVVRVEAGQVQVPETHGGFSRLDDLPRELPSVGIGFVSVSCQSGELVGLGLDWTVPLPEMHFLNSTQPHIPCKIEFP